MGTDLPSEGEKSYPTTEQEIVKFKAILTSLQEKDNDKLHPELLELRHHVLFMHERIHGALQFLLLKAIYQIKKSRSIRRLALKMLITDPILTHLGYKQTVDACVGMGLMTNAEKDAVLRVNTHRNNFGHRTGRRQQLNEYEIRINYQHALVELLVADMTQMKVYDRYIKRKPRQSKKLLSRSQTNSTPGDTSI